MTATFSTMLPLGTKAPAFKLLDTVSGKMLSLDEVKSSVATVIMFICNHCPFVKHIQSKMVEIAQAYQEKGVRFVAISANDVEAYPADDPLHMCEEALQNNYCFPYLYDETQAIALAYHAACTPDFFIFDKNLSCVYRGRFDASTPRNQAPVNGQDLTAALEAILTNKPVSIEQHPSLGCNIKWKNKEKAS